MTESTFLLAHDIAAGNINLPHTINVNFDFDPNDNTKGIITGLTVTTVDYNNDNLTTLLQQVEDITLTLKYNDGSSITENNSTNISMKVISRSLRNGATGNSPYFYFRVQPTTITPVESVGLQFKFFPPDHLPQDTGLVYNINTSIFNPTINTELFENSDYNPIISNAIENRDSSIRQVSDRNQVTTSPANIQALLSGSADAAQIPDSNYTSVGITNSRYEGSKTSAETFNSIEPSFTGRTFKGVIFSNQITSNLIGVGSTPGGSLEDALGTAEDAVVEDILQTGTAILPTFSSFVSSSYSLRGNNISNNAVTIVPFLVDANSTVTDPTLEANNIIRQAGKTELMRVEKVDVIERILTVERGYGNTATQTLVSNGRFERIEPIRFFKFDQGSIRIASVDNSKIFVQQSGEVVDTDKFGFMLSGSVPLPTGSV